MYLLTFIKFLFISIKSELTSITSLSTSIKSLLTSIRSPFTSIKFLWTYIMSILTFMKFLLIYQYFWDKWQTTTQQQHNNTTTTTKVLPRSLRRCLRRLKNIKSYTSQFGYLTILCLHIQFQSFWVKGKRGK